MAAARGFITVATGRREYYVLAHNLLLSYRFHTKDPLPFAILCDRENALTRDFDDVVVIDSPKRSFTDKFRILDLSPYDESIFIDADSLAYSDLNGLWDVFKDAPPFGILGRACPPDSDRVWLDPGNAGIYKEKLEYLIICQGGIYYVRKDGLKDFRDTVDYILGHYAEFKFRLFPSVPSDETIFSLACSVHRYLPPCTWSHIFGYYPDIKRFYGLDIRSGVLEYIFNWQKEGKHYPENGSFLLHWGSVATRSKPYILEAERLRSASEGKAVRPLRIAFACAGAWFRSAPAALIPNGIKSAIYKLLHKKQ